MNSSKVSETVV